MYNLVIEGGQPLRGTVAISGAKNAALPILMGAILLDEPVTFTHVPDLRDIHTTLKLMEILGRPATYEPGVQGGRVTVTPGQLQSEAPYDLVKTMRASVLCLGPLLARLHEARVAMPGGCAIGARPVDLHLSALEKMGAYFDLEAGYIHGRCDGLMGAHIQFDFPTVGGTENLLMAACLANGETVLENAAREPEVVDLARFLIRCGAKIEGHGTSVIRVNGVQKLHGCDYAIMPDRIEAGTFLVAAGLTDGDLLVQHCPYDDMEAVIAKLRDAGMSLEVVDDPDADAENTAENAPQHSRGVTVRARREGKTLRGVDISTRPHPGFPTDMQAQFMSMLCLSEGSGIVEETIFENRFMHVQELVRLGADIRMSGSTAVVRGVAHLVGAPVMASDLRASASLVLAGLTAKGTTTVQRIYHLDRGYEHMETKLQALGARIQRVPAES